MHGGADRMYSTLRSSWHTDSHLDVGEESVALFYQTVVDNNCCKFVPGVWHGDGADAACIVTEWDEFRALDLADLKRRLKSPVLVDLRNVFRPEEARAAGLTYSSIGRAD